MTDDIEAAITKRSVLRAAGTALATGVGLSGGASAHTTCDKVPCNCVSDCSHCSDNPDDCDDSLQVACCGSCSTDEHLTESDCDIWHRFCTSDFCVQTDERAEAYSRCPFDAVSHEAYIEEGQAGQIADICYSNSECFQAVKVDFCGDTWWIRSDDLVASSGCFC